MAIKIKNKGEKPPEEENEEQQGTTPGVPPADAPGSGLDGFERLSIRAAAWIENNRQLFFGIVAAVLVAGIGVVIGMAHVQSQQVEASDRLSEGFAAYEQLVEGSPELEAIRAQDGIEEPATIFDSVEERWQRVYDSAAHTLEDFDGGPIADTARLTQAAAALNLENYEEAEQLYRQVVDADDISDAMRAKAYVGLANALAVQSDLEGAEQAWDEFSSLQPERRAYAEFEMARMVERYGDADEAAERYADFVEEHADSQYVDEVERRRAML